MSAKRHLIQLDVTNSDIDRNNDTYDLRALLKASAVTKWTYNLDNLDGTVACEVIEVAQQVYWSWLM